MAMRRWMAAVCLSVLCSCAAKAPERGREAMMQAESAQVERQTASGRVITWRAPEGEAASADYGVEVEGMPVFVWPAAVRHEILKQKPGFLWTHAVGCPTERASFAAFDLEGRARVRVTANRAFRKVWVWPTSAGIVPTCEGNVITFELDRPRYVTLCLDDDTGPLHFLVTAPERDVPEPDAPNVVYFGPGVHEVDSLQVKSGQTVYLAGGAVLRARIHEGTKGTYSERFGVTFYPGPVISASGVRNVRICGRGMIDGSLLPHPAKGLIRVEQATDVRIEGVILRDSPNWNVHIAASENVRVDGIKIISGRLNSDGINPTNSRNVSIRDCFIRNRDDGIAVKTLRTEMPSRGIAAARCVLWSDWGYALGVTYETRSDIDGVCFRDCDIIFTRHWALGVLVVDAGTVRGVGFEDIRVEDFTLPQRRFGEAPMPAHVSISKNMFGTDAAAGGIRGVTFRRVSYAGGPAKPIELRGFDAEHRIEDVRFDHVTLGGRLLGSMDRDFSVNAFVADVSFAGR